MGTQRRLLWTFVGCWMWILHELGTAFAVPATTEGQLTQDETLGTDEPKPFAAESDVLQGVKLETADRAATSADAGNSPTPFPPGFSYGEANIEITRVPTHLQLLEAHTVSWLPAVFEHDITTRGDGGEDSSGSGPSPGVTAEPSIAEAKTLPRTTNSSRSSLDNGLTTTTPDAEEAAATAFPFPGQISSFSSKVEPDASSSVPAAASRFVGLDKVFVAPVPREGTEEELISAASKAPLSPSAAETELMGAAVEGTTRAGALSRAVPLPTDAGLGMTNSAVGAQEETAVSNADGQNEVDAFTWSPDTSAGKATESLLWSTEDLGDMESSLWSSLQAEAVTGVREPSGETTPSTATSPDEAEGSEGASEMDGTNDAPKATAPEPPQPSSGSRTVLGTSDNTEEMSTVAFGAGEDDAVPAGPADAEEGLYPQASSSTPGPSQPPSDSKMHSGLAAIQGRGDADSLASAASEGTVGDSSPQSETHPVSLDAELSPDSTAQPLPGAWANAGTSLRSPLEDGEAIHAPEGENSGPTSPSEAPTESSFSEAEDAGVSPAPGSPQPTPDAKADVVRITKEGAEVAMSSGLAATETQEAWLSGARGSLPNTGVETSSLAFAGNEEATASITDTQGQTSPSPSGPAVSPAEVAASELPTGGAGATAASETSLPASGGVGAVTGAPTASGDVSLSPSRAPAEMPLAEPAGTGASPVGSSHAPGPSQPSPTAITPAAAGEKEDSPSAGRAGGEETPLPSSAMEAEPSASTNASGAPESEVEAAPAGTGPEPTRSASTGSEGTATPSVETQWEASPLLSNTAVGPAETGPGDTGASAASETSPPSSPGDGAVPGEGFPASPSNVLAELSTSGTGFSSAPGSLQPSAVTEADVASIKEGTEAVANSGLAAAATPQGGRLSGALGGVTLLPDAGVETSGNKEATTSNTDTQSPTSLSPSNAARSPAETSAGNASELLVAGAATSAGLDPSLPSSLGDGAVMATQARSEDVSPAASASPRDALAASSVSEAGVTPRAVSSGADFSQHETVLGPAAAEEAWGSASTAATANRGAGISSAGTPSAADDSALGTALGPASTGEAGTSAGTTTSFGSSLGGEASAPASPSDVLTEPSASGIKNIGVPQTGFPSLPGTGTETSGMTSAGSEEAPVSVSDTQSQTDLLPSNAARSPADATETSAEDSSERPAGQMGTPAHSGTSLSSSLEDGAATGEGSPSSLAFPSNVLAEPSASGTGFSSASGSSQPSGVAETVVALITKEGTEAVASSGLAGGETSRGPQLSGALGSGATLRSDAGVEPFGLPSNVASSPNGFSNAPTSTRPAAVTQADAGTEEAASSGLASAKETPFSPSAVESQAPSAAAEAPQGAQPPRALGSGAPSLSQTGGETSADTKEAATSTSHDAPNPSSSSDAELNLPSTAELQMGHTGTLANAGPSPPSSLDDGAAAGVLVPSGAGSPSALVSSSETLTQLSGPGTQNTGTVAAGGSGAPVPAKKEALKSASNIPGETVVASPASEAEREGSSSLGGFSPVNSAPLLSDGEAPLSPAATEGRGDSAGPVSAADKGNAGSIADSQSETGPANAPAGETGVLSAAGAVSPLSGDGPATGVHVSSEASSSALASASKTPAEAPQTAEPGSSSTGLLSSTPSPLQLPSAGQTGPDTSGLLGETSVSSSSAASESGSPVGLPGLEGGNGMPRVTALPSVSSSPSGSQFGSPALISKSGKMPPALQANGDSAAVSHVSAVAAREGLATTPFPLSVTQAREDDTGAGFAQEGTALASAGAGESVADARGQPTTPVPLYPYGAKAKDKEYVERRVDFNSRLFKPAVGFPFGKTLRDALYFTDNGQIIFPASDNDVFPYPNPPPEGFNGRETVPMVAVFWDNADFSRGVGTTFYQEFMTLNSAKPPFIQDVEARIRRYVGKSYSAVWTLKITWVKAPAYPAWRDVTKTNTYQAVLTTDGVKSYVLILYQDGSMQWDYTRRPATNVLIGYSSGDGFYQNDNLTQRPPAAKYRPDQFRGYSTDLRGLRIYKLDSRVRANYRVRCLSWASKQQEPGTWNRDLPPCPCSLQQGESDGRFRRSKGGWLDAQVTMLYTASPNQYGAGVRCLYSKQNKLIDGRQEKYWKYSRQASPFRDQELKLQDWCCNQTGSPPFCALYGQKRPKIGCDGYRPSNLNPAETSSEESGSRSEKRKRNHRTRKFT
ncbi:mucin-4 isoform X2 [Alligator mississippiensis]|uniref:mucin-4 isoform X2 n=1 Tax=Alligator mississippiensis TaxID=8496 RepID=UPI0006EC7E4A|nr:mucin-4 isoform X2 [Alligator mississippiensis]